MESEQEIRTLIDQKLAAIRSKNIEQIMADYAVDVIAYDMLLPFQISTANDYRKNWEMAMLLDDIECEVRDLEVAASGDVAFSYSLAHIAGTRSNGQRVDMWFRTTTCFRRFDGKWLIVNEHTSVPIDPESGQAVADFKPE